MPLRAEIDNQWKAMVAKATVAGECLAAKHDGITVVALAGAWARGLISDADVDFLVVTRDASSRRRVSSVADEIGFNLPLSTTTFVHTERDMRSMAGRRSEMRLLVGVARRGVEYLKRHPALKRKLKQVLGARQHSLQRFEILPPTVQTLMPLVDSESFLANLQREQRVLLDSRLSPAERLLYGPMGFARMLDCFLGGEVALKEVELAMARWDVDPKKYLRRAMDQFEPEARDRIAELYHRAVTHAD